MFTNRPAFRKELSIKPDNNRKDAQLESEFKLIRDQIQEKLLENSKNGASMEADKLRTRIEDAYGEVLEDQNLLYNHAMRNQMLEWIVADIIGHGPIEPLLEDPEITEVMVNGYDKVYIERFGLIEPTDVQFEDDAHLLRVIDRIVSRIGRRIDESSPMVDARLPNGYRVNATIPPLSLDGPILTIRKFATEPYTVQDLIANGTVKRVAG